MLVQTIAVGVPKGCHRAVPGELQGSPGYILGVPLGKPWEYPRVVPLWVPLWVPLGVA